MSERIAYFDCYSGASGDMLLAALVDAGAALDGLSADIASLACGDEITLRAEEVKRCSVRALRVHVETEEHHHDDDHHHHTRNLPEIREIIQSGDLPDRVKANAVAIFERLAEAEATVHGMPADEVHFHEVGALDAIADIVGVASALDRLGVGRVLFSTLSLGNGIVRCAHGTFPVPAPATAQLIQGLRCEMGPAEAELLTPTGAAILTALGTQEPPPPFELVAVGVGAGAGEFENTTNVLRVLIGSASEDAETDAVWVLETNLDDTTPEICGHAIDELLAAGAVEAWATPVLMKKSRPAVLLTAIADDEALSRVEETFFRETTTFGVRRTRMLRSKLRRESRSVDTPHGPVRVKIGRRDGIIVTIAPEFEDCRKLARECGLSLREVYRLAQDAARGTE